jgi:hypothetical protein
MRPEYDFSRARRGVTAKRYVQGANVILLDPDLLSIFTDSAAVNQAPRALAKIIKAPSASGCKPSP